MYSSIAFIWKKDTIIGYCNTLAEADHICTINSELNWSYSADNQNPGDYKLMNIYDFF